MHIIHLDYLIPSTSIATPMNSYSSLTLLYSSSLNPITNYINLHLASRRLQHPHLTVIALHLLICMDAPIGLFEFTISLVAAFTSLTENSKAISPWSLNPQSLTIYKKTHRRNSSSPVIAPTPMRFVA